MRVMFLISLLLLLALPTAAAAEPLAPQDYWAVSFDLPALNMSDVESRMKVRERRNDRFRAHSRPGALREFHGFWRSFFGRLTRSELSRGAWLHLVDGQIHDDGSLSAKVKSVMLPNALDLQCPQIAAEMDCRIQAKGEAVGAATIRQASGWELPIRDYSALLERIEATAGEHVFHESVLEDEGWLDFTQRLEGDLPRIQDDLDMLVAWYGAIDLLPVSHVFLQRGGRTIDEMLQSGQDSDNPLLDLDWDGSTAILRIESFGVPVERFAEELAQAFASMQDARALVLDLRGNGGGNLSSMLVAAHLLDEVAPAGYFVSRAWWRLYNQEPTPELAAQYLPAIEEPDLERFFRHLDEDGGVQGRVRPRTPGFRGPVYVLTNRRTASASEPLVWHLQSIGATLVGEPTAGAMLSSNRFDVGDGWYLILPVADYHTAQGERLEGHGVTPDYSTASADALEHALSLIQEGTKAKSTAMKSDPK